MKRVIIGVLMVVGSVTTLFGQTDAKAKAILSEVSKKYRSFDVIKADFTVLIDNPGANIKETESGTLYVKSKTNKYKVVMDDQELFSDGVNQWAYLKEDKEVQLSEVDHNSNSINPAKIFTIYEKGYKYLFTGDTKSNGRTYHNIDLTPGNAKGSFFKVRLKIDKLTKLINSATIFDKNGSRYTYTIKSFSPNVKVSDAFFAFDAKKHPGVEVVDLR